MVEDLQFSYRNGPEVLKHINFSLEDGQCMAILGNNGAGKSTLLKCFNRILPAKRGKVHMDGQNLLQMSSREIAKRMAFVAQNMPDTQMTVHDIVTLGRRPYMRWGFTEEDHRIVHEAMEQLGLLPLQDRFLNQLSGGERQKVVLARALAQQPKILLLDEPTSNLDLQNQYQVLKIVQTICHNAKIAAIVVLHDLNLALRFCDRFLLMKDGRIYRYGNADMLDRAAISDVYGVNAEIIAVNKQHIILVD